mmetsp:Transcript_23615/g.67534  ORF Transcript_23615/g.67534 Transcript_23615/m.67534 type:complete len:413 (-) Transcript_23615:623-1861(-)
MRERAGRAIPTSALSVELAQRSRLAQVCGDPLVSWDEVVRERAAGSLGALAHGVELAGARGCLDPCRDLLISGHEVVGEGARSAPVAVAEGEVLAGRGVLRGPRQGAGVDLVGAHLELRALRPGRRQEAPAAAAVVDERALPPVAAALREEAAELALRELLLLEPALQGVEVVRGRPGLLHLHGLPHHLPQAGAHAARVAHDRQRLLRARERHTEPPRISAEAQLALLVAPDRGQDHVVRLGALRGVHAEHAGLHLVVHEACLDQVPLQPVEREALHGLALPPRLRDLPPQPGDDDGGLPQVLPRGAHGGLPVLDHEPPEGDGPAGRRGVLAGARLGLSGVVAPRGQGVLVEELGHELADGHGHAVLHGEPVHPGGGHLRQRPLHEAPVDLLGLHVAHVEGQDEGRELLVVS